MKKIILTLFLILGLSSFAAPEYVDVNKMEKDGYIMYKNQKDTLVAFKLTKRARIAVTLYFTNKENSIKKALDEVDEKNVPKDFKILASKENDLAYIRSYLSQGLYINIYVAKNSKNENCYPIVSFVTPKKLSEIEIEQATQSFLDEAESFLK